MGTNATATDTEARARAGRAAMDACPDCNHSGFVCHDGTVTDCHCAAPFRAPAPATLAQMDGEDMHPERRDESTG